MYFNFTSFLLLLAAYIVVIFQGATSAGLNAIITSLTGMGFCYAILKGLNWAMTTRMIDAQKENIFDSRPKTYWMRISQRTIYGHKGFIKALKREMKKPGSVRVGTRLKRSLGSQLMLNLFHDSKEVSTVEMQKVLDMIDKAAFVPFSVYADTLFTLYQKPGFDYLDARVLSLLKDPRLSYQDLKNGRLIFRKLSRGEEDQKLREYAAQDGSIVVKTTAAICRYANDPELMYSPQAEAVTFESDEVQEIFQTLVLDKKFLDQAAFEEVLLTSKALSG